MNKHNEHSNNNLEAASLNIIYMRNRQGLLKDDDKLREVIYSVYKTNTTHGDSAEKLKGFSSLYAARLNDTRRLIYTWVEKEGKKHLLLVRLLEDHNYNDLKKNKKNLDNLQTIIDKNPDRVQDFPIDTLLPPFVFKKKKYKLTPQQCYVFKTPFPMAVSGTPGSGKSSIGLSKIAFFVKNSPVLETPQTILFTAIQPGLTRSIQKDWEESEYYALAKAKNIQVVFKSYGELADATQNPRKQANSGWLKKEKKHFQVLGHDHLEFINSLDEDRLFQEFNFISSFSKEEYCDEQFGRKNTLFHSPEHRKIIFDLFEKYNKNQDTRFSELDFNSATIKQLGNILFVVCDETQDLSTFQLEMLYRLSNGRIIYCLDTNQSLNNSLSIRHPLREMVKKNTTNGTLHEITLTENFRNPACVIKLANRLLKMQRHITGGRIDKQTYTKVNQNASIKEEGFVFLSDNVKEIGEKALGCIKNKTKLVVITDQSHVEEAQKIFSEFVVLTYEQSKGLEYPYAMIYKPFDNELFRTVNDKLTDVRNLKNNPNQRRNNDHIDAITPFNAVYTACTRPTKGLFIYQPDKNVENIIRLLNIKDQKAPESIQQQKETTAQDWEKQIHRMLAQDKSDIAMQIWQRQLGRDEKSFYERFQPKAQEFCPPEAQAASSSQSQAPRPKISDLQAQLDAIWENFNEIKLQTLLKRKDRHSLLFKSKQVNESLIEKIYREPEHYNLLRSQIINDKFRQNFYTKAIYDDLNTINNYQKNKTPPKRKGKSKRGINLNEVYQRLITQSAKLGLRIDDLIIDNKGTTLLMHALEHYTDIKLLNQFIENSHSFDCKNQDGNTLLHFAAANRAHFENKQFLNIIKLLVNKNEHPHTPNEKGETPFTIALACGNKSFTDKNNNIITTLDQSGARENKTMKVQFEELFIPMHFKNIELFTYLVSSKRDGVNYPLFVFDTIFRACLDKKMFDFINAILSCLPPVKIKYLLLDTALLFYIFETLTPEEFDIIEQKLPKEICNELVLHTDEQGKNLLLHTIEKQPAMVKTIFKMIQSAQTLSQEQMVQMFSQIYQQNSEQQMDILMLALASAPDLFEEVLSACSMLEILPALLTQTESQTNVLRMFLQNNVQSQLGNYLRLLDTIKKLPKEQILEIYSYKIVDGLNALSFSAELVKELGEEKERQAAYSYFTFLYKNIEQAFDNEMLLKFFVDLDHGNLPLLHHAIKNDRLILAAWMTKALFEKNVDSVVQQLILQPIQQTKLPSALRLAVEMNNVTMIKLLLLHILTLENAAIQFALLTEKDENGEELFIRISKMPALNIYALLRTGMNQGLYSKLLRQAIENKNTAITTILFRVITLIEDSSKVLALLKREHKDDPSILELAKRSKSASIISELCMLIWSLEPEHQHLLFSEVNLEQNPLTYYLCQPKSVYSSIFYGVIKPGERLDHVMGVIFALAVNRPMGFVIDNKTRSAYFDLEGDKKRKPLNLLIFGKLERLSKEEITILGKCRQRLKEISNEYKKMQTLAPAGSPSSAGLFSSHAPIETTAPVANSSAASSAPGI